MTLKRQLLLVSLLALVLPWAGCQFIRETESALRSGQQQMLAGAARAIAESLGQYVEEFPAAQGPDHDYDDQLYGHPLETRPEIDGYFDDWSIGRDSLRELHGKDGLIYLALGIAADSAFLYVEVSDKDVIYAYPGTIGVNDGGRFFDVVHLINSSPPYRDEVLAFAAEAPGPIITYNKSAYGFAPVPTIIARWQDTPRGYQIEARIPLTQLGTNLGIVVSNTSGELETPIRSASFNSRSPGAFITVSPELIDVAAGHAQPGMRLIVTDRMGWRVAASGDSSMPADAPASAGSAWLRIAYAALVESGQEAALADPDPSGREQQDYIVQALAGQPASGWFRSTDSGRAIVAVAQPVTAEGTTIGAIVMQQGTDAILSLANQSLVRLMNVTLIATLLVAAALLGYASWLSRRIRRLSNAAELALDSDRLSTHLPSSDAGDEIGDLSRSFSSVLNQLGDYNDYLRSLASKLSHELRTPLAIVTSSLENLEHEPLNEASRGYAARARDGADRLRKILTAMSEASRVEELMANAEPEVFDLYAALDSTVTAYRDVYAGRGLAFDTDLDAAMMRGSPELIIQMLDKLIDNAVDFSSEGDTITIGLRTTDAGLMVTVSNPGPPLPERMRSQLFDSMVSMRPGDDKHLGLGLYVARLIAEGHGGRIEAQNTDDGVTVTVTLRGETHG